MDFLIDGIKYAAVVCLFWAVGKVILRRYAMATTEDSNETPARKTDWDVFWGRKRTR